jgi:hypothetical protein
MCCVVVCCAALQSSPAAAALASRLQFHKLLLQALVRLQQRTKPDLDAAAKLLQKARTELAAVKASAGLGQSGDLGVDPGLNSHLTPAVPMRVVEVRAWGGGGCNWCFFGLQAPAVV